MQAGNNLGGGGLGGGGLETLKTLAASHLRVGSFKLLFQLVQLFAVECKLLSNHQIKELSPSRTCRTNNEFILHFH
jgi:hypothetical protein